MKANTASRTAQFMAFFRALESKRPPATRLFEDPYASLFLDRGYKRLVRLSALPLVQRIANSIIQHRIPGALASGVARTRYIDDLLRHCVSNGTKQVIILGAGFDTRALRLDFLKNIPVIEVDHPDTAKIKTGILDKALHKSPSNIHYLQPRF
ncbi:MAG TPA: class I SAM-dependent methyltransferase [Chitinophagaceae bacterium]